MEVNRDDDLCVFNGILAENGEYLFPSMSVRDILDSFERLPKTSERALMPGIEPKDLAQTGWGVVFHSEEKPEVKEALAPLLRHRQAEAAQSRERLYREFSDNTGYHGESKEDFLATRGAALGVVNPNRMPYYLLLVGEPDKIPFHFQQQLDVQYGVGRICFDTPEEYALYAQSVVAAETGGVVRKRRVSLFGVHNPDDEATQLSADFLVRPLAERLATSDAGWEVRTSLAEEATKERLSHLLGGDETPAVLFTASHGMGFSPGATLQREHQGALLCQDWPGPQAWKRAVPSSLYFSSDDIGSNADLHGLLAFHFACHGVGTPAVEDFAFRNGSEPRTLAPTSFVARLPQRLLAHPKGGALAVIGHVERAWAYSFMAKGDLAQYEAFEAALDLLMKGYPVGFVMEYFNMRYAELSTELTMALQRLGYGEKVDPNEIAALWTANNDARNYAVLGDPAVRVAVG
jgi:hypothetical protein